MSNYAEELVYWYLRFNGFFPIVDFVIHRTNEVQCQACGLYRSDSDILAVRMPSWEEMIGAETVEECPELEKRIGTGKLVGIIGEVKSGEDAVPESLYDNDRVAKCERRIGFAAAQNAMTFKILFSHKEPRLLTNGVIHLPLKIVYSFLRERIGKYRDEKHGARLFFPSHLMQYFMDKKFGEQPENVVKRRKCGKGRGELAGDET